MPKLVARPLFRDNLYFFHSAEEDSPNCLYLKATPNKSNLVHVVQGFQHSGTILASIINKLRPKCISDESLIRSSATKLQLNRCDGFYTVIQVYRSQTRWAWMVRAGLVFWQSLFNLMEHCFTNCTCHTVSNVQWLSVSYMEVSFVFWRLQFPILIIIFVGIIFIGNCM